MDVTHLKSRSHIILEAIILTYAESGAPVGSEALCNRYSFGVSSATVRNVMAELEAQGLITHPHTSAGRVPTDLGYRYYVDLLMDATALPPEEEELLSSFRQARVDSPVRFLEEAATALADLTREAGVVLVPQLAHGSFRHLELIPVGERELVAVFISSEGLVRHFLLETDQEAEPRQLERLQHFLNRELFGMSVERIYDHLETSLLNAGDDFYFLYKQAIDLLRLKPFLEEEATVILVGASRVLDAPEFRDIRRTRRLVRALEQKESLAEILRRDLSADGVKLHIGRENRGTPFTDCAIAAAPFGLRGGVRGTVGVLGPTRMNYPRVCAQVARMAQAVTQAFREKDRERGVPR